DTAYDETGRYIRSAMTVERNVERSYIRCGVTEEGEMYMASVYFGANPPGHTGLRLTATGGTVAETPSIPADGGLNYRFTDLGNTTEVVSYKGEHCKAIVSLVCITGEKERIRADYTGGKPYTLYLSAADREAIRATCELAGTLSEISALQKGKAQAGKKIELIDAKLHNDGNGQ
ncbi:MAG: hypothetical protein LBK22_00020, partial [Tannerella sp.]|nr:hypothetical protein [Tannerella sp.]